MSKFALTAALILAAGAAHAAAPEARQAAAFSFMGQSTETATKMTALDWEPCKTAGADMRCDKIGAEIGDELVGHLTLAYHGGRLSGVDAVIMPEQVATFRAAFVAKYGQPTRVETRQWIDPDGNVLAYPVAIWRLKDGDLELRAQNDSKYEARFTFVATGAPRQNAFAGTRLASNDARAPF